MAVNPAGPARPELPPAAYARMTLVLRLGLVIAVLVLIGALAVYLAGHPGATSGDAIAHNPILGYLGLIGLARGLASGAPAAFLTLGLLVLVATPIVRVVSGLYYFERNGERTMSTVALAVLVLLLVGLLVIGPWVH
jgi:uncharacterized membrane protein